MDWIFVIVMDVLTNKTTKKCNAFDMKSSKCHPSRQVSATSMKRPVEMRWRPQEIEKKLQKKYQQIYRIPEKPFKFYTTQTCWYILIIWFLWIFIQFQVLFWSFPFTISQCHEGLWFLLSKTRKFPWCPTGTRSSWAPGKKTSSYHLLCMKCATKI